MAKSSMLQVRIDETLRKEADLLFADLGMDTQTAVRIFLKHAVTGQGMPFAVARPVPNAETIAALENVRAGRNLVGPFDSVKELMDSLKAAMAEDEEDGEV